MKNNWDKYGDKAIPKNRLITGNYYAGICRQSNIARWDGNRFIVWREKFGRTFLEDTEYWDLNDIYDGFIPLFDLGDKLPDPIDYELYNNPYKIIFNGTEYSWRKNYFGYEDACRILCVDSNRVVTVTMCYADDNEDYIVTRGQEMRLTRGKIIINACITGNS